jgi:hypothetical protein
MFEFIATNYHVNVTFNSETNKHFVNFINNTFEDIILEERHNEFLSNLRNHVRIYRNKLSR